MAEVGRAVARWLAIPEGLGGRALRMLALVFALSAGLAVWKAAQSGVFLGACSRAMIPWAFGGSSLLLAGLSALFVSATRSTATARLGEVALVLAAASSLGLRVLVGASASVPAALATYVVIEALSGVLIIQVWAVATAATDARSARRLLPLAGIGGALAWGLAGVSVAPFVARFGTPSLLLVAPVLFGVAWALVRAMARHDVASELGHARPASRRASRSSQRLAEGSLVSTLRFIGRVPLLRMMTVLSLVALVVEEVMDFHVMAEAREELRSPESISTFFGHYYAATSVLGALFLAGPAARALAHLGATRSLLVTPLVTFALALVAALVPGLGPAVLLRGTARVLKQALWSNAQEQMQSPIAHARRTETRAAIRGVLAPLGYAVAASGLALVPAHVDGRWLAALVALLSGGMAWLVATRARRAYLGALERAVDPRRLVLGTGRLKGRLPRVVGGPPAVDAEATEVLARELESVDAGRAALAAEVLGSASAELALGPLVRALTHAHAEVRRAAAVSLARLARPDSVEPLAHALASDEDAAVRIACVEALREIADLHAEVLASPALAACVARIDAREPTPAESPPAEPTPAESIPSGEREPRVLAVLRALAARREAPPTAPSTLGARLLPLLRDSDPFVRCSGLAELTSDALLARGVTEAVRSSLAAGTPDERVAAAESVVALGAIVLLPDVVALLREPAVSLRVARLLVALGDDAFGPAEAADPSRTPAGSTTVASLTLLAQRVAHRTAGRGALVHKLLAHRDRAIRRAALHALASAIRAGEKAPLDGPTAHALLRTELARAYRLVGLEAQRIAALADARDPRVVFLRGELAHRLESARTDVLVVLSMFAHDDPVVSARWPSLVSAIEASRRTPSAERDAYVAELLDTALATKLRAPVVALFERASSAERLAVARSHGLIGPIAADGLGGREVDARETDAFVRELVALGDPYLRRVAALVPSVRAALAVEHPREFQEDEPMIPRFERVRFLRQVPLFARLDGDDLVSLAGVLEEVAVAAGEAIFRRGEPGEDLYVVVDGRVSIGDGAHVFAELGPAEFFGDLAVLDHEGRSADATALVATELLRLRGADLRELMATRPEITQGIVQVLVARLREADRKLAR